MILESSLEWIHGSPEESISSYAYGMFFILWSFIYHAYASPDVAEISNDR